MAQAEPLTEGIVVDFLWECFPPDEFDSEQISAEYFGHRPSFLEATAAADNNSTCSNLPICYL